MSLKKILFSFVISIIVNSAFAYDITVENSDGVTIYYKYSPDGLELTVTDKGVYSTYSGSIVIPDEVTYMGRTRKVTKIDERAFFLCEDLKHVTLPKYLKTIETRAFEKCTGLMSIIVPCTELKIVKPYAFFQCNNLKKVVVNDIKAWCDISFEYGDSNPLQYSEHIFSDENNEIIHLEIPEGVESIKGSFCGCSSLLSVKIPNSVTVIDNYSFYGCKKIKTFNLPNGLKKIGWYAFSRCISLDSINLPHGLETIGGGAFSGCTGITSITIPSSVIDLDRAAFQGINLRTVTSLITNLFAIYGKSSIDRTFDLDVFNNAILYVPRGSLNDYKGTRGWRDFVFVEEMIEETSSDLIQVETAMKTKFEDGILVIEGIKDSTIISIYDLKGVKLGTTMSMNGLALIKVNSNTDFVILKIGDRSIKVVKQ